jgi:hypothetical protein
MRIREAQKHTDPLAPIPERCRKKTIDFLHFTMIHFSIVIQRWVAVCHRLPGEFPRAADLYRLRAATAVGAAVPAGDQRPLAGTRRHQTP